MEYVWSIYGVRGWELLVLKGFKRGDGEVGFCRNEFFESPIGEIPHSKFQIPIREIPNSKFQIPIVGRNSNTEIPNSK